MYCVCVYIYIYIYIIVKGGVLRLGRSAPRDFAHDVVVAEVLSGRTYLSLLYNNDNNNIINVGISNIIM